MSKKLDKYYFEHELRKENSLAHIIATVGMRRGENTYLEGRVPDFVVAEAEYDRRR
ncbi:hypothetical protein Gogos_021271 [Gossypium gossypioides]|uniref:Uncharacterized protein n=1 Tax=Gossypium gossypioides TaxID=34282 RepID=A0A7J9D4N6_GOSGO|nr:hypothetical protein [Gossypium gossypioides]